VNIVNAFTTFKIELLRALTFFKNVEVKKKHHWPLKIFKELTKKQCCGSGSGMIFFPDLGSLPRPKIQFILTRSIYFHDFTFKNGKKRKN
jgi:hypothetical protein